MYSKFMAVLNLTEVNHLRSFFLTLDTFRRNPAAQFAQASLDGVKTTVFKSRALDLLRSKFSSLSGEEFKDDNLLINYLSNPKNQDRILSELPKNQWKELSQQIAATVEIKDTPDQSIAGSGSSAVLPASEGGGVVVGERSVPSARSRSTFRTPRMPGNLTNAAKNFGSTASIFAKKGGNRLASGLSNFLGNVGRGGGGALGGLVGAGGRGLGSFGLKTVNGGLDRWQRLASARNRLRSPSIKGAGGKAAIAIFGALFLFMFFSGLGAGTGSPGTPTGEAAPIPPLSSLTSTASITSCKFIQQGVSYRVGSSKLQSLFEEAAAKSGVPSSLLAAIAMQETTNFTAQARDDNPLFSATDFPGNGCEPYSRDIPASVTGALGLMQIQPPSNISTYGTNYRADAADLEGIKIGLSFLGRDPSSLTKNDFCNIRTNIYLAAGVIINKNRGKAPTTADEARAIACSYMGACQVGTYSYADEIRQSFEACKTQPVEATAGTSECLIANAKVLCGSQFTPVNGCGHCGLNYGPMGNCVYEGTRHSIDIAGAPGQTILLPKVNNSMIQWVFIGQEAGSFQAIQKYAGTDPSGKKYYLQLHHTQPGNGNAIGGASGEAGGAIWGGGDHVHVQIGDGGDSPGNTRWLDAAQNFCRKP